MIGVVPRVHVLAQHRHHVHDAVFPVHEKVAHHKSQQHLLWTKKNGGKRKEKKFAGVMRCSQYMRSLPPSLSLSPSLPRFLLCLCI